MPLGLRRCPVGPFCSTCFAHCKPQRCASPHNKKTNQLLEACEVKIGLNDLLLLKRTVYFSVEINKNQKLDLCLQSLFVCFRKYCRREGSGVGSSEWCMDGCFRLLHYWNKATEKHAAGRCSPSHIQSATRLVLKHNLNRNFKRTYWNTEEKCIIYLCFVKDGGVREIPGRRWRDGVREKVMYLHFDLDWGRPLMVFFCQRYVFLNSFQASLKKRWNPASEGQRIQGKLGMREVRVRGDKRDGEEERENEVVCVFEGIEREREKERGWQWAGSRDPL